MIENIPVATHQGTLKILEGLEIPCAVLEDGTRILSSRGFLKALGRPWRGVYKKDRTNMPSFLAAKNLTPFISNELNDVLSPVIYQTQKGTERSGYKAELLPMVCDVYLKARDETRLPWKQERTARACDLLMRALAHVGIIALVDEATGYQHDRAKDALEKILQKFISKELSRWVKTFPNEYYEQMFRLRGLSYHEFSNKRPSYMGRLTNDIVYERLAPGVLKELQRITPKDDKGRRAHKYFQRLTDETGYPRLKEHLWALIGLMRVSPNWRKFHGMLERAFPKYGSTPEFPDFPTKDDDD
jgi:hypothetical protein